MSYFNQQSNRLRFRKLTPADIPNWLDFFPNNPHLEFLGLDMSKSHLTMATEWINMQLERYDKHGLGHLAVEDKATGLLIGLSGIIPREILGKREYEVAYSLKPKYWGKGLGTEISKHFIAYGFANLPTDRLISIIDTGHSASQNVARKNGMEILFETEFMGMMTNVFGLEKSQRPVT